MMNSMTGFGSTTQEKEDYRVSIRLRSVNHRHLDVAFKMPEELREAEVTLRRRIGERLHRGRIEVRIDVDDRRERPVDIQLDRAWLSALRDVSRELQEEGIETSGLGLSDLLRFPDLLRVSTGSGENGASTLGLVTETLDEALRLLAASRAQEGEKLHGVLLALLEQLSAVVGEIESAQPDIRAELEGRLQQRLAELADRSAELEEARISQEIALLVEKSDVREELDRLNTHLVQFRETMQAGSPIGKKLDFIAQEILRELSTLGAKCRQAGAIQQHIDAKLLCEQMREQVQNIE